MTQHYLTEVATADARWSEEAQWAIAGQWDLDEAAQSSAEELRAAVLHGHLALSELRAGVAWVNALDKEAGERYGFDLRHGAQLHERTARRLMHLAGRQALRSLASRRQRDQLFATTHTRARVVIGMGSLETHDIRNQDLVQ